MSIQLQDAVTLIEAIDDIATDKNQIAGTAEHALDAIHRQIIDFFLANSERR